MPRGRRKSLRHLMIISNKNALNWFRNAGLSMRSKGMRRNYLDSVSREPRNHDLWATSEPRFCISQLPSSPLLSEDRSPLVLQNVHSRGISAWASKPRDFNSSLLTILIRGQSKLRKGALEASRPREGSGVLAADSLPGRHLQYTILHETRGATRRA